jgi:hypothetical protein
MKLIVARIEQSGVQAKNAFDVDKLVVVLKHDRRREFARGLRNFHDCGVASAGQIGPLPEKRRSVFSLPQ